MNDLGPFALGLFWKWSSWTIGTVWREWKESTESVSYGINWVPATISVSFKFEASGGESNRNYSWEQMNSCHQTAINWVPSANGVVLAFHNPLVTDFCPVLRRRYGKGLIVEWGSVEGRRGRKEWFLIIV